MRYDQKSTGISQILSIIRKWFSCSAPSYKYWFCIQITVMIFKARGFLKWTKLRQLQWNYNENYDYNEKGNYTFISMLSNQAKEF